MYMRLIYMHMYVYMYRLFIDHLLSFSGVLAQNNK